MIPTRGGSGAKFLHRPNRLAFSEPRVKGLGPQSQARRWARRAQRDARARAVARRVERQMRRVGGSVTRALSLRRRLDVAGPAVAHGRKTSFWGGLFG